VTPTSSVEAVHDNGMFELDGNVVHDSQTTPPYDWTSLFGAGGTQLVKELGERIPSPGSTSPLCPLKSSSV